MDPNRQKQKKTRNSYNNDRSSAGHGQKNGGPTTKTQKTKNGSSPKSSVLRFDQPVLCFKPINTNTKYSHNGYSSSSSTPSSPISKPAKHNQFNNNNKHIVFAQLKYPRKNRKNLNDSNMMHNGQKNSNTKSSRPTFQFKIGLQVGVALGDCFLHLQKLENSMDKLRNVSEDITDVMCNIEEIGGTDAIKQNASKKKSKGKGRDINDLDPEEDPIEEVHVLNDNLLKWQKDAGKRMKNVSVTVAKLQNKLEELDEHHSAAQKNAYLSQQQDRTDIDKAYETIKRLQLEVDKAKMELNAKSLVMQQLKKSTSDPNNDEMIRSKLHKLESKEKELDRDAEIIATQSEELRKESERLLTERDEVRKQKEQWQKMIDEVKEQKAKLEKRESELQANHKKLLELHETLSDEKKKLHKKAKKIKSREKRLNALRDAASQKYQVQNQYQVPSSNGSDYAESELTYFSDGDTELASVNSISDDESQTDNYHKQQLKAIAHLGVPQNPMF